MGGDNNASEIALIPLGDLPTNLISDISNFCKKFPRVIDDLEDLLVPYSQLLDF